MEYCSEIHESPLVLVAKPHLLETMRLLASKITTIARRLRTHLLTIFPARTHTQIEALMRISIYKEAFRVNCLLQM